jgi:hypothetical protein
MWVKLPGYDDFARHYGGCCDVSPSARAEKRDWFKTAYGVSWPSCTKASQFKSHPASDLRELPEASTFCRVRHGLSWIVMDRHGVSMILCDRFASIAVV